MSLVKTNAAQIGQSVTATNNFTMYQPASPDGTVRWGVGNSGSVTDIITLNSSGNVGIGTSSPVSQLHLQSASDSGLTIYKTAVGAGNIRVVTQGVGSALAFGSDTSTGTTERMRIDSSGNVGIGTSSPTYFGAAYTTLEVKGKSGAVGGYVLASAADGSAIAQVASESGVSYVGSRTNTPVAYITNNTERMRINSSGNVGIGTSSPGYKLDVSGQANLNGIRIGLNSDTINGTASLLAFQINGSESMRIDSSGNLLVGTTNSIIGFNSNSTGFSVNSNGRLFISQSDFSYWNRQTDGTIVAFARATVNVGNISVSASSTTYNTASDYRLKENIQPMQGALGVVAQLNPVTYNWKADGSEGQGFIAHELQAVVPDCVTGEKDAVDAEGKPVYQGIDTSFLVATLTKAIQELTARIEQLEAK